MQEKDQQNPKQLKGFYGKVNVSVKTLDKLIVIGVVALIGVLCFGLNHRGYTITFDCTGGTPIESQKKMYNELVDPVKNPTREGYTFDYWSRDLDGLDEWVIQEDKVSESMTLYANWLENE
ncbi:MAG: InlB B-repeat-containing protein [Bacillota bacterium]|nr:InlB B-repeat-containing protein [Bacillota bacterium]